MFEAAWKTRGGLQSMKTSDRPRARWRRFRRRFRNLFTSNPKSSFSADEVEEFELEFYKHHLREGMTVFDIGSNVGMMARYFSNCVGVNGTVHCFEPGERAWARLAALGRGPEFENLVVNQTALGKETGLVRFHVYPESHSSWNTSADRPLADYGIAVRPQQTVEVPCTTLDAYCAANSVDRIDLAKVDVERAELQVLQGAARLLRERRINCLLMEFGQTTFDMGNSPGEIEAYADSVGYHLRNLIPGDPTFPGGGIGCLSSFPCWC